MDTIYKQPKKQILAKFSLLIFSFFLSINCVSAQDGEKIFKQNCAVCHSLGSNTIVGPGLQGVISRVPSEEWMFKWIQNNEALIKSGDAYAVKVSTFSPAAMPSFTTLADADIKAVIKYVKEYKEPAPVAATAASGATAPVEKGANPLAILIGVLAFLILLVAILRAVRYSLKNIQNANSGLPNDAKIGFWKEFKNSVNAHKRTTALVILFLLGGCLSSGWYALKGIGVYEGYQPTQPIAFSHKIHAGDNAIDCQYCHSGAEKSKTAGIPSVNVCMNCHKGISKGPITGKTEIAKIYEAAGWDPDKGAYTKPQKPIQWIKVHNLPDFVFFSHQQHVKVGQQDCATCHGDVKTMTTAVQVMPLTMVWCINCHRATEVPGMQSNPYYEKLHKNLTEKFKNQPFDQRKITVDRMGGIE